MWREAVLACCLSCSALSHAAVVTDAAGRTVALPDRIQRVVAAVSNAALYGRSLTPAERDAVVDGAMTIRP